VVFIILVEEIEQYFVLLPFGVHGTGGNDESVIVINIVCALEPLIFW